MEAKEPLHLPVELTDIVIDYLHDDTGSLRFCSLVSQSWVNATRYHLFHKVHLVLGIVNRASERMPPGVTQLEEFTSKASFLWPYVRILSIGAISTSRREDMSFEQLQELIKLLPLLNSLELRNITITSTAPPSDSPILPIASLRQLTIVDLALSGTDVHFGSLLELFSSVRHCRILGRLNLLGKGETPKHCLQGIRSLVIQDVRDETLIDHLSLIPFDRICSTLTSFTIGMEYLDRSFPVRGIQNLNRAFEHLGSGLRHLRVDYAAIHFNEASFAEWEKLTISPCTSLETLGLCLFSGDHPLSDDDIAMQWSAAVHILNTLPPNVPIREVVIGIFSTHFHLDMVSKVRWRLVEEQLLKMKDLRTIRVHSEMRGVDALPYIENAKPFPQSTKDALESCMPEVVRKGLLTFL